MTPLRIAGSGAIELALLGIAIGLAARGRWRLSWSFDANILAAITFSVMTAWWHSRFYTRTVLQLSQTTFELLRFCFALEVGWSTFRPFPGARRTALCVALAILIVTVIMVAGIPMASPGTSVFETARDQFHPRVIIGGLWLMVAVLAVARWYRVPVHPYHAAILASWAGYDAVLSSSLSLLGRNGPHFVPYSDWLDVVASLLLTSWWCYVTWRPESEAAIAYVRAIRKVEVRTTGLTAIELAVAERG